MYLTKHVVREVIFARRARSRTDPQAQDREEFRGDEIAAVEKIAREAIGDS